MLKKGQILYDNDPRYPGRKVEVVRVEDSYDRYHHSSPRSFNGFGVRPTA